MFDGINETSSEVRSPWDSGKKRREGWVEARFEKMKKKGRLKVCQRTPHVNFSAFLELKTVMDESKARKEGGKGKVRVYEEDLG